MNANTTVWLYRGMRTGSTWLANTLAHKLNKKHVFLEYYPELVSALNPSHQHASYIFSTHLIENLYPVKKYQDMILIRTARRNLFEQMLSLVFFGKFKKITKLPANISDSADEDRFVEIAKHNSCTLTENDVISWLTQKRDLDNEWNIFSKNLPHQTIYYEDLQNGIFVKNTNIFVKFDSLGTQKLPEYKRNVFSNYEEIKHWFNYHKNILDIE